MKWIEPTYSKKKVKRSGEYLVKEPTSSGKFKDSIPVFHNWRSAHAYPMQIMLSLLRKNAVRVDKTALVVQRLKRVPSIFHKLFREKNMSLSRMEDIAGCRAVVKNTNQVYRIYNNLKNSRTRNILFRERDYIARPKESGYRGIHLVYKYNGSKDKFKGLPVELQIRSKIQHSWATAVEVVGTFTKQALKASRGDKRWLDFFKLVSIEFEKLEGLKSVTHATNTFEELEKLSVELDVESRLRAFNVAVDTLTGEKEKSTDYYILLLDLQKRVINIARFSKPELTKATDFYNAEEEKHRGDFTKDLVMVSAKSLKELKKAYPNYFLDTVEFSKNIEKVFKANK